MTITETNTLLKKYWGYNSYRLIQEKVISKVLNKENLLVLMPTGGGKSVCFQIPALYFNKICIVVSPLIALMQDQVNDLLNRGISAIYFSGSYTKEEWKILKEEIFKNKYQFLYISPERLESKTFLKIIELLEISLIVVDEAHCISQFGHDFRPAYLKVSIFKQLFPKTTLLALTASATPKVQEDIKKYLFKSSVEVIASTFTRSNLSYSCFNVEVKINKVLEIIASVGGSGLIYCQSQAKTEYCSHQLKNLKINCDFYHAGLNEFDRQKKLKQWLSNSIAIMVCTNAFGMGINKPDLKFVIHYDCPPSLENYYQEAGRAGRDGKNAYAVLLYTQQDLEDKKKEFYQRFPPIKILTNISRKLYQFYPSKENNKFDLNNFCLVHNFSFPAVLETIQQLVLAGYLKEIEYLDKSSKILFILSPTQIHKYIEDRKDEYLILRALLKLSAQMFSIHTPIHWSKLCQLMQMEANQIHLKLMNLKALNIIDYQPKQINQQLIWLKQIYLNQPIFFNVEKYNLRQDCFKKQNGAMLNYLENVKQCRNEIINNYFGQPFLQPCKICDICLELKNKNRQQEIYNECLQKLKSINQKDITLNHLFERVSTSKKKYYFELLNNLVEENKISINENGQIIFLNLQ